MKKLIISLIHIGVWSCYLIILMIMMGLLFKNNTYDESYINLLFKYLSGFAIIPPIIAFYSFYFLIFPNYIRHKNVFRAIMFGVLISIVVALIGTAMMASISGNDSLYSLREDFMEGMLGIFFIALVSGTIALLIKGFITWFEEIKLKDELKQKNHEMELAMVKSQLDPHFLFNTINNIDVLILKSATHASDYLNKLSDIMRFMLFETKSEKILISKEVEYIEKYIELQKIRTANSNYVNYKLIGNCGNKTIAPMIFIPFIENAFKHTANKKLENAIAITIIVTDDFIKLKCVNKLDVSQKIVAENSGLGNELIQKRLHLIYPEKHVLDVFDQGHTYNVDLTINNE